MAEGACPVTEQYCAALASGLRRPSEFRGRTERGESGRVATYSPLRLPLELSLRLCVPTSPGALCVLTSPGANLLASGMLFSGRRVSELLCERQLAYVLRRLGGSERSTDLARSTQTAASQTTHPPRPGRMVDENVMSEEAPFT